MITLKDYTIALKYLVYIGCEIPYSEIFLVTDEREIMEANYRRVYCGFIFGKNQENWVVDSFLSNKEKVKNKSKRWACKMIEENQVI